MSVYSQAAEVLQYISPEFYKQRFFKKLKGVNRANILQRRIEPEMLWVKEQLTENGVFMDIGANVGAYLYLLERQLKPQNIYAFEPNIQLNKRLKRLFPDINVSEVALSDLNTVAEFKIPVMHGKAIHSRGTLQKDLKESGETSSRIQQVQVMPLDEWMRGKNINRIDLIKIDVEGNEHKTLLGARETLVRYRPVLMVEMEQRHHSFPVWNIIEDVCTVGYTAHYFDRSTMELTPLTRAFLEAQDAVNVKNHAAYINNIIFLPEL